MPIPEFQAFLLPALQLASDGEVHSVSESVETIAVIMHLDDTDRQELLPSGRQRRLDNRVYWAFSYLRQAKLLESAGRGRIRITSRGREVLGRSPSRIDIRFLEQFPEFVEFKTRTRTQETSPAQTPEVEPRETPEELLEASFQTLRGQLARDLLDRTKSCSSVFFEHLVVDLLVAMGYGGSRKDAGQAIGRTGDGGIDGIIKEDRLGLDVVYVQAKRWDSTVGRPVVQAFAGSLEGQRARKGVLITTSTFSKDALDYVTRIEKKIVLIDGEALADMMIDHGIGVATVSSYDLKRVDPDYFGEAE